MLDDDDPEIGYGKPPKSTQYKKGQSGNPKGRPKSKDLQLTIIDVLNKEAGVDHDGTPILYREAFLLKVFADGINGKPHAVKAVIELLKNFTSLPGI